MAQWEFMYLQASTNQMATIKDYANRLGALGWEPVGMASADKTVGMNSNVLILKREITPDNQLAPPATADEWQRDPSGRHEGRRWSGRQWTADVVDGRKQSVDPPTRFADPPLK